MKNNLTKKQMAAIAGIIAVGVVLALLIMLVKPSSPAKEAGEEAVASEHALEKPSEGKSESGHEPQEEHSDEVKLTDAQIKASGIGVLKAGPAKIHTTITLPGEIRFNEDRTAQVVPLLEGVVQGVSANVGQAVKKGQVLAVIASTGISDQRSQLLTTEKRLSLAKTTYEREKKLWEEKISAEQDYLQARQAMQEAEIERNNAQQKLRALGSGRGAAGALNSYELRAPFDGVVVEKHISLGQSVKEDSNLFTISDLSTVWAEVAVPASDLGVVRVGEKVTVRASAFDAKVTGKIAYVGSLLGAQTRTATARIVLTNPNSSWRPGLFVNVDVEVASSQQDVTVAVASTAIQTIEDKPTVFVRAPGGFVAKHVTLGRSDATTMEVVKGLEAGSEYAAAGSFVIKAELGKSSNEDAD
jgi:cobalt-zinc-cadmium efflux system membrane fusion protein